MTKVQQDTNRAKLHEGQGKKLRKERRISVGGRSNADSGMD